MTRPPHVCATTVWVPLAADLAVAYVPDAILGGHVLMGVVAYEPTSPKLRGIQLRQLGRMIDPAGQPAAILSDTPPSRAQLAEAWTGKTPITADSSLATEVAAATAPGELARRDGEPPEAFSARIARAYRALSQATATPTTELARRAGVPVGTASAWLSHARKRGLL